jgi:hypothetical protein
MPSFVLARLVLEPLEPPVLQPEKITDANNNGVVQRLIRVAGASDFLAIKILFRKLHTLGTAQYLGVEYAGDKSIISCW